MKTSSAVNMADESGGSGGDLTHLGGLDGYAQFAELVLFLQVDVVTKGVASMLLHTVVGVVAHPGVLLGGGRAFRIWELFPGLIFDLFHGN